MRMSHTDKDRPYWVKTWQDGPYIDHDHRLGECVEETLDFARYVNGRGWVSYVRHRRACAKNVTTTFYCTKRDPYTYSQYRYWGLPEQRYRITRECWIDRCRCDLPRGRRHTSRWDASNWSDIACPTWGRIQCEGHEETRYDASVPCLCDAWPKSPTCGAEPRDATFKRWFAGGVPSWFVTETYHRPERARERKLRDYVREYNAYGDLEDGDFVNRQGRSSARWDWW